MNQDATDFNSPAAAEERQLLGISQQEQQRQYGQAPVQQAPHIMEVPGVNTTLFEGDNIRLANLIYGEVGGENEKTMAMVGSTALNRLDSGRINEFGDTLEGVIRSEKSPYYASSQNSNMFQQAESQNFPDEVSERAYKKALQIANGLIKGTIPRTKGMFFFKGSEVSGMKRSKKKGKFDFKKVKETGKVGKYFTYSY